MLYWWRKPEQSVFSVQYRLVICGVTQDTVVLLLLGHWQNTQSLCTVSCAGITSYSLILTSLSMHAVNYKNLC